MQPVDVPGAMPPTIVMAPRGLRRFLAVLGVIMAFVVPALILLFDDSAVILRCQDGVCVVVGERALLIEEERHRFAVDDVVAVSRPLEFRVGRYRGRSTSVETGHATLMAEIRGQGPIAISTSRAADSLPLDAVRAALVEARAPDYTLVTRVPAANVLGLLTYLLLGLVFLAGSRWSVVVGGDPSLGVATVMRRRPPLPHGVVHRLRPDDIVDITTPERHGIFYDVVVRGPAGRETRVCRTLNRFRTAEVKDAILARVGAR